MKTVKNLYPTLCSYKNLEQAFHKACKGKRAKEYVQAFEQDIQKNLLILKKELETEQYIPSPLKKFTLRDPKTRVIRKSTFRDRVVHHAIVNILEPIYEEVFIYDSYANRKGKGTSNALKRYDAFLKKVTKNGQRIPSTQYTSMVKGYVLKADIKHFFDSVNQKILLNIFKRKIKDKKMIGLLKKIIQNFDKEKGMPLGNMTSQFFANVYLNELDYVIKHTLRLKYYIRYVDDFIIFHRNKRVLEECKEKIEKYLININLELHPEKSKITALYKGINFLGFRCFYFHKCIQKRNMSRLYKRIPSLKKLYGQEYITADRLTESIEGWCAYALLGNTYRLRKRLKRKVKNLITS